MSFGNYFFGAKRDIFKNPENNNIINDSTSHLIPSHDVVLAQITVQPKGVMLPSMPFRNQSSDWFTSVFLLTVMILVLVRISSRNYFTLLIQSIGSFQSATKIYREQNISLMQGSVVMELYFLIVLALFGYQVMELFGVSLPFADFTVFLLYFGAIFLFIRFKLMIYKFLGFISETAVDTREYIFNMQNYNKLLGLLLLPIVAFIAWLPFQNRNIFMISGLILTAVINLFYLFRGAEILLKKQYSIFYLFLYLCTLEILPLLLFLKVLQTS